MRQPALGDREVSARSAPIPLTSLPSGNNTSLRPSRTPPSTSILTSKSALEGERKQVTILFADLKGSTDQK
jgi:hypothetical protein